jgi:outer membrane protein
MSDRRFRFSPFVAAVCALATLSASPAAAQGQPPALPPGPLTLEQALEVAEGRSEAIAIARAAIRRTDGERVRARSGLFPQLSASASYDRALASEFEGVFDSSGPACSPFALNPQASIDARVSEIERAIDCGAVGSSVFGGGSSNADEEGGLSDLPFGRANTWRASLSFSQNVYSGGRIGAQTALAEAGRESAGLALTTTRGQLLFEVTQAYFDAALSSRLVGIADATLQQAGDTLKQTQASFDAGTQPEFEVLRARVSRDNQLPVLLRQRVNREVAMLRLKQLLDLPVDYDLQLADALGDDTVAPPPVFAPRVASVEKTLVSLTATSPTTALAATPLPERTAIAEAQASVRQSEVALRQVEAERRPSVTLNSAYTRAAYPSGVFPTFDRTTWTVGASVQVPILTGGRQRGDELVARANIEERQARLQQVQELAALDSRSAWAELLAARATWESSAGTVQQASRAYEIADVRYRAGVSTQLELSDSRLQLQLAEANRAQAARDLQVARARVALLPDLPVGTGNTGGVAAPRPVVPVPLPVPQAPQTQPGGGQFRNAAASAGTAQAGIR